jgi:hypothetical protein
VLRREPALIRPALPSQVRGALVPVMTEFVNHAEEAQHQRNHSWQMLYNPITPGTRVCARGHGRYTQFSPPSLSRVLYQCFGEMTCRPALHM